MILSMIRCTNTENQVWSKLRLHPAASTLAAAPNPSCFLYPRLGCLTDPSGPPDRTIVPSERQTRP